VSYCTVTSSGKMSTESTSVVSTGTIVPPITLPGVKYRVSSITVIPDDPTAVPSDKVKESLIALFSSEGTWTMKCTNSKYYFGKNPSTERKQELYKKMSGKCLGYHARVSWNYTSHKSGSTAKGTEEKPASSAKSVPSTVETDACTTIDENHFVEEGVLSKLPPFFGTNTKITKKGEKQTVSPGQVMYAGEVYSIPRVWNGTSTEREYINTEALLEDLVLFVKSYRLDRMVLDVANQSIILGTKQ